MLEGLEISEIDFSFVKSNLEQRIDSEFYSKKYLKVLEYVNKGKNLSTLAETYELHSNGAFNQIFNILHKVNSNDIKYIRSNNVGNFFIEGELEYISEYAHSNLSKTKTLLGDIITARTGKVGGASVVTKEWIDCNSNQNVVNIRIKNKDFLNPYYLTTYLNTEYGIIQFEKSSTGNVQSWLNLSLLRRVKIILLSTSFQDRIENLVAQAHSCIIQYKQTYTQAENILLEEIDLQDFTPCKEPVNIKSFKDSFATSGRLDAEYYQPKYEFIENKVKSYSNGFSVLDDFIDDFSTGFPYKSKSYIESGGIPIIRINNINKGSLDVSDAKHIPLSDLSLSEKDIAKENDLLISMSGTIGNTCRIPKGIKAVVNQRIMKITPKNYNVEVLPLVINSIIGELQLNRIGTGGVQTNISSNDIRKIFIPNIYEEKQQEIADLIEQSFSLKKQSEHLLEVAKKAVELAIEKNEEKAIEYIVSNT